MTPETLGTYREVRDALQDAPEPTNGRLHYQTRDHEFLITRTDLLEQ